MKKTLLLIVLIISPITTWADSVVREIRVSATGRASAVPDLATVRIGVTREARNATDAMNALSEATARLLLQIRQEGIDDQDVQTASLSLNPVWDQRDARPLQVRGYIAGTTLSVRVRALDGLGALLDMLVSDGANTLNGVGFSMADPTPLEDLARRDAVQRARTKAQTLAEAAGVNLGQLTLIQEGSAAASPQPRFRGAMIDAEAVPIAAGDVEATVSVTLVYAIDE